MHIHDVARLYNYIFLCAWCAVSLGYFSNANANDITTLNFVTIVGDYNKGVTVELKCPNETVQAVLHVVIKIRWSYTMYIMLIHNYMTVHVHTLI